ncbi:MAG TPA: hypothetical protein DEP84_08905, partial [Chloroflexi bacterium]|nr:hypothetical protein [Chloroflexota bacterium]
MHPLTRHSRRVWVVACSLFALWLVAGSTLIAWQRATALPAAPAERALVLSAEQRSRTPTDRYLEQLQLRLRDNPADLRAMVQYGHVLLQKARETADPGYYNRAEAAFAKTLALDRQNVDALLGQGSLALARHDFATALRWGEQAQALAPDRAAVYGVIADAQIELGRYDAAAATLQTMVDLHPDLAVYSRISYLRELHGDIAGAIEAMTMAIDAGAPYPENSAWTIVQLGMLHFNQGDLSAAEYEFQRAQSIIPDYLPALAGLARVRAGQGRLEEALTLAAKPVEQLPLPAYVILYGELLEAAGRKPEAAQQFELVRALQQLAAANGVVTDLEMALFEADHGDPTRAVALAEAARATRPSILADDALAW